MEYISSIPLMMNFITNFRSKSDPDVTCHQKNILVPLINFLEIRLYHITFLHDE